MTLAEKYRPKMLAEVVGQEKAVRVLSRIAPRFGGRAFYLQGKSGQGKTTIARIIAREVADPKYGTWEKTGRELTVADLKDFRDRWSQKSWLTDGYALIVNESHGMNRPVIEVFLDILEGLPENAIVIFTTTIDGAELFEEHIDAGPFASRCIKLALTSQGFCIAAAKRLKQIAQAEGCDGQPESAYVALMRDNGSNMRAALNAIETGEMIP